MQNLLVDSNIVLDIFLELMMRDVSRYRTYFPTVTLICPENLNRPV
jgi:hypothetical protein